MAIRIDLTFVLDDAGWSERYYLSPPAEPLGTTVDRLIDERMKLVARPCRMTFAEARDTAVPGSKESYHVSRTGNFFRRRSLFAGANESTPCEIPEVVALMKWVTPRGRARILTLGGIPESQGMWERDARRITMESTLYHRLNAFRDALHGPQLNLQIKELIVPAPLITPEVRDVRTSDKGLYLIETDVPFPTTAGERVRIIGSRGRNLERLRGIRRVVKVISDSEFVIDRGPLPERGPIRYTGGAKVYPVIYGFTKGQWRSMPGGTREEGNLLTPPTEIIKWPYRITSRLRGGRPAARRGRDRKSE